MRKEWIVPHRGKMDHLMALNFIHVLIQHIRCIIADIFQLTEPLFL
uniref:Uncharacterized protein n=1 Tax=Setaria italica TaxID=4555 RepID=K4ANX2_SETIT